MGSWGTQFPDDDGSPGHLRRVRVYARSESGAEDVRHTKSVKIIVIVRVLQNLSSGFRLWGLGCLTIMVIPSVLKEVVGALSRPLL